MWRVLAPLTVTSPLGNSSNAIWSSRSSSHAGTGHGTWLLTNAVLQCRSCALWPHSQLRAGTTRRRHGSCCWVQLGKLHKLVSMHGKVRYWALRGEDLCHVLVQLMGVGWSKILSTVVVQWSPKRSCASCAGFTRVTCISSPSSLATWQLFWTDLVFSLSDPCGWSTTSFT